MLQNDYEITSWSKFWNQHVQFWYLHHPALSNSLQRGDWGNPTSPLGWHGLGLRLFQSSNWEGLPFPLPPSLGCGSRRSRVGIGSFFGARFEPPFFHHLGPPKIVITSYFGSKAIPFWGPKRGPKQAPTSELAFSLIFLGFLIFSIPPQVPPV